MQRESWEMSSENDLWLCFFRGLNVFGHGKISRDELKRRCIDSFERSGVGIQFVNSYRATGNIAVLAPNVPVETIGRALKDAVPTAHALVPSALVDEVDQAFRDWATPADVLGFRWTRGVCLLCEGEPGSREIREKPDLGRFLRVGRGVVAVYRKERETDRGTLDPNDRAGGWAAVSRHIEDMLGGVWTARSFDTPRRLRAQALWRLRV